MILIFEKKLKLNVRNYQRKHLLNCYNIRICIFDNFLFFSQNFSIFVDFIGSLTLRYNIEMIEFHVTCQTFHQIITREHYTYYVNMS